MQSDVLQIPERIKKGGPIMSEAEKQNEIRRATKQKRRRGGNKGKAKEEKFDPSQPFSMQSTLKSQTKRRENLAKQEADRKKRAALKKKQDATNAEAKKQFDILVRGGAIRITDRYVAQSLKRLCKADKRFFKFEDIDGGTVFAMVNKKRKSA